MGAKLNTTGNGKARLASEPNVIPFIDILLVLLIIFMVTAPLPTVDIKVDLPPPHPVHVEDFNRSTIVFLRETPGGVALSVDGQAVNESALIDAVLMHARANNPAIDIENLYAEARIYVRADQSTAYANVVHVIDTLQGEGFAKVGIFADTAQNDL